MHKPSTSLFLALSLGALAFGAWAAPAGRSEQTLTRGWEFTHGHPSAGDQAAWQQVNVPHDWAISGPFSRDNDLQLVAVEQNGETEQTWKTGRTGGLPFIGKGAYRTFFEVADTAGRAVALVFDGAMSNAHVRVNGTEVIAWPYGYNSFWVDVTPAVKPGSNLLEVDLENYEKASRWYPGAGLYRNVHLVNTPRVHVPVWGTHVTTPLVTSDEASIRLAVKIAGLPKGEKARVETVILSPEGNAVASNTATYVSQGQELEQSFRVEHPSLWSPDSPALYTAVTTVTPQGSDEPADVYETRFGLRSISYVPERGFFLNGEPTKFKGVCLHHDLGPLGAAVNRSAIRHQLEMLKEMGVNAVRTSHNMPAPELVELCDEMGVMLMLEPFDDWSFRPKSPNGYGAIFNDWSVRDVTNMVEHYRNSPSVVMWSSGNEVPSQWGPDGVAEAVALRDLIRSLDPSRPVTNGMDQIGAVLDNGFAASLDLPGFNYKPQHYERAYAMLPQRLILGSETASTVSSRGVYKFPLVFRGQEMVYHPDNQSSSYDNEACYWSNTPDLDFLMDDLYPWVLGQFVWTGFDYLGEPTPYDTDAWPSHSSLFGIIDLASLPKDRFWLYRSQWRNDSPTLHVLPHWTWPGREGEVTPVMVYTSWPSAELFVNGESQGVKTKDTSVTTLDRAVERYRLIWPDVVYEPGELRVVAYDAEGRPAGEQTVRTAGKPYALRVETSTPAVEAGGADLAYITVSVVDRDGVAVPTASNRVKFSVKGDGRFVATANGDPTCTLPFQAPEMDLFSGACTAIVAGGDNPGSLTFTVTAKGLKPASLTLPVTAPAAAQRN